MRPATQVASTLSQKAGKVKEEIDMTISSKKEHKRRTPYEALLHQIELCKMLETGTEFSEETRKGAADLRIRLESRFAEEFQNK